MKSVRIFELPIYSDETCKDHLFESGSTIRFENITSMTIFLRGIRSVMTIPLGFQYTGLTMDQPFTTKELDSRFVTENGDRKLVLSDLAHVTN